ncbi:hypothetical protein [Aneurinibacillus aneurinilyticus]|jgi:hypothetical protein|uniref:hypothetical protein n=1 Tax=Aneurinibacillus aneurinilyticus TaxID=1391 RepID=UPI0023F457F2|nr:hypothetical protein [Aneurinibacillus aneurinilyticus]MCI1696247.1 hypothetical protein [Aneurinibacillus aneurinilyticus]
MDEERVERGQKEKGRLAEVKEWDPLDTPQIAESREAQRRLGRGAEMPGLYEADKARTEDGEEEMTKNERLASIQKNLNLIKQGITQEAEKAKAVASSFKNIIPKRNKGK